jgi:hypothetical protein
VHRHQRDRRLGPGSIGADARGRAEREDPSQPDLDDQRDRDGADSTLKDRVVLLENAPEVMVKQLIAYLLDNMILDFQGNLTLEMVREFLRDDESRESRALLSKLVEDRGVSDMMITLADCLQDAVKTGINEDVLRDQIRTYAES